MNGYFDHEQLLITKAWLLIVTCCVGRLDTNFQGHVILSQSSLSRTHIKTWDVNGNRTLRCMKPLGHAFPNCAFSELT